MSSNSDRSTVSDTWPAQSFHVNETIGIGYSERHLTLMISSLLEPEDRLHEVGVDREVVILA